jgi:hypothetical protein
MGALSYLYPFHPAILVCWSELKSKGVQDTLKITSMPYQCLSEHPNALHMLDVCAKS